MINIKFTFPHFAVIAAILIQCGNAWNIPGHLFMATVAYNDLLENDPVALFWAEDLLKLYNDKYTDKNEDFYKFIEAVAWADDIKKGYGSWQRFWHFVDIPYVDPRADPSEIELKPNHTMNISLALPDLCNWLCGYGDFNSPIIDSIMQRVANEAEGRSVALRLLMHYVGDVHQPLHVTELYSKKYRSGDLGGNLVKLREKEGIKNLHQAWDSVLYYFVKDYERPLTYNAHMELVKKVAIAEKDFSHKF